MKPLLRLPHGRYSWGCNGKCGFHFSRHSDLASRLWAWVSTLQKRADRHAALAFGAVHDAVQRRPRLVLMMLLMITITII